MQTPMKMGTVRVTPIDDVIKSKSLNKKKPTTITKTSINGEIRLSPGGVQLRVARPEGGPEGRSSLDISVPISLSANKLKALAYRSISRKGREQEAKETFMAALRLQPRHTPPPQPTTKAHVAHILGGTKAIKSFLRSPVTPLSRVACMATYFRHKGALVQFTPPAAQAKPKTSKNGKTKKAQSKSSTR